MYDPIVGGKEIKGREIKRAIKFENSAANFKFCFQHTPDLLSR